jgi:hypothetical protein
MALQLAYGIKILVPGFGQPWIWVNPTTHTATDSNSPVRTTMATFELDVTQRPQSDVTMRKKDSWSNGSEVCGN